MTLSVDRPVARRTDGFDVVRAIVFAGLLLDVVASLIASMSGVPHLGPTDALANLQSLILVATVASWLWWRRWPALVLTALVAAPTLIVGPVGTEPWLLVVSGVAIAVRAPGRLVALGGIAHLTYAVALGVTVESRRPGWGWPAALTSAIFSAAAFAFGALARRLLRARDVWRRRVLVLRAENARIRSDERRRLADDLQRAVIAGLERIRATIAAVRGSVDATELRRALDGAAGGCRSLTAELRTLLEVLRAESGLPPKTPPARWRPGRGSARHLRVARLVATVATVAAALSLALMIAVDRGGGWDVLPVIVLCLIATLSLGPNRLWLVLAGFVGYAALVALTGAVDAFTRLNASGYGAILAVTIGLVIRHLLQVRRETGRDERVLLDERARTEAEERGAVARELHDVVAHQLSVASLVVLATSGREEPAVLRGTLDRVEGCTDLAAEELDVLLRAMRGSLVGHTEPSPVVVAPLQVDALLSAMESRLEEQGFRTDVRADPGLDTLDATTRQTLGRILQEGTTNVLRYASPGSACEVRLTTAGSQVGLDLISSCAGGERRNDLSSGWGLRGIRERVELLHGTFRAGPEGSRWALRVRLPVLVGSTVEPVAPVH